MLNKKVMGAASGATPSATDPDFEYVTMLLHGDGTNGAQNNTFVSTPVSAPSGGFFAGYFDGSGDWLGISTNAAFDFGTGDFTVEAWVFLDNTVSPGRPDNNKTVTVFSTGSSGSNDSSFAIYGNTTNAGVGLEFYQNSPNIAIAAAAPVTPNSWVHVAWVRSGTTIYGFVNGTRYTLGTTSSAISSSTSPKIGIANTSNYTNQFKGYISNLRVVKGTAVYTANFTPPSGPLTAITNTSLLTCNNGVGSTFTDLSTNNFTITANGNAAVRGVSTAPPGTLSFSGYFDGNGDYITCASNSAFEFGTGQYTVEFWLYFNSVDNVNDFISTSNDSTNGRWCIYYNAGQVQVVRTGGGGATVYNWTPTAGQWYHIAASRDASNNQRLFVNGALVATATSTNNYSQGGFRLGWSSFSTGSYLNGYISNVRIVKGTAVYTSNFAPPNAPLTAISGTSLLTCQSSTFVDNSPNAFTITVSGNTSVQSSEILPAVTRTGTVTQGSLNPFGDRWSNYFDGSTDYLDVTASANLQLNGDFTIEGWCWLDSTVVASRPDNLKVMVLYGGGGATSGTCQIGFDGSASTPGTGLFIYQDNPFISASVSVSIPLNSWVHIAFVRTGSTIYGFVNGTRYTLSVTSGSASATLISSGQASRISGGVNTSYIGWFKGYISNFRVLKGTALYTANFTPPTAPLTAITNTSLLTCQSNRFRDNSSNNFTITRNGDVAVRPFSPFAPSAAYSTSVNGGSSYYGTTDSYLTLPDDANLRLGNNNFTFEMWFYKISNPGGAAQLIGWNTKNDNSAFAGLRVSADNNGTITLLCSETGTSWQINTNTSAAYVNSAWNHIAAVRNGATVTVYVNGTSVGSGSLSSSSASLFAGTVNNINELFYSTNTWSMIGYISNARLVIGSALYTAAFTPPTSPLTGITGTQLLLNFTNAGIFDNAADNVLETVGNAQISTSVKKYGTGSLAFDGTGDFLIVPRSPEFEFGSGDFTVEGWFYRVSTSGDNCIFALDTDGFPRILIQINSTTLFAYASNTGTSWNILGGLSFGTITSSVWYHFALTRQGSTFRAFLNGNLINSATSSASIGAQRTDSRIGMAQTASGFENYWNGYIDDFRITKGVARYTANFTPPTAAFPDL